MILYRVSRKSLAKEIFEYLYHISTKRADIFTTDKRVLVIRIHKGSFITNRFEVFTNDFNKEL